ncbi:hypothetical protein EDD11_003401 [Mortierella claussenii]|nr:hypothetical protein EDD11_003401 [Mortierella claussenii]
MSALSRIPGIAQLTSVVAATFSVQSNPTLRRYNDALAQAFYHHGRLCASNQATVMVLVIVFVGMISYPGIITSYNSSTYARQRFASTSVSSSNLSLSPWHYTPEQLPRAVAKRPTHRHQHQHEGDLDAFWTQTVIAPTWTQDPDVFNRNLPSTDPLNYIAPIIINATDLLSIKALSPNMDGSATASTTTTITPPSLSTHDLLLYAAGIQRRMETIVVEYSPEDRVQAETDKRLGISTKKHPRAPRLISLQDICLLEPSTVQNQQEDISNHQALRERRCLVHSPRETQDIQSRHHFNTTAALFGDVSFGIDQQYPTSLIMTYFLRGDLGKQGRHSHSHSHDEATTGDALDVKRAWRLIFSKLVAELQAERAQQEATNESQDLHDSFSVATEDMSRIGADTMVLEQNADVGKNDPTLPSSDASLGHLPHTPFVVKGVLPADASQTTSRRLVSEGSVQLRTNISAEYWLLGMAYFVMFLYISLSVGRVDLVKSKYGLGIAAVATVFVSLLMSIGLCSVFGVTLTLMPWEILPFMIIVVGVENINILVHAVVETSMDLPVRERVGRGLGTVGVSITMTLVAELSLLIVGAMTTIPAVQEFCTFAIAAVIMDYLLQMTFFITVVSIDIRRLELSDLSTRPAAPYSRYPFGSRHPVMKTGGSGLASSETYTYADERTRHHRNDSTSSYHSDGEAKNNGKATKANPKGRIFTSIIMVGVMAYLGYIYGTTNQAAIDGDHAPVTVSYWQILSTEASSKFWSTVDPDKTGGYVEIEAPLVLALLQPSSLALNATCHGLLESIDADDCGADHDGDQVFADVAKARDVTSMEGQLDPRRPFKLLRNGLVFICMFAIWLIRVFVIPSIILAAAILLLLSYLLSPQRKLLVDLQWRFPFIVLPGDYQSKRKLMMEELLAQEAREQGQNPSPSMPLPGTVDTLHLQGHRTDIDQMDVSQGGHLVLTSSMDGTILLWCGGLGDTGQDTPLARLEETAYDAAATNKSRSQRPKSRPVKFLKLDPSGGYAIAGYGDGGVHVWKLDSISYSRGNDWTDSVVSLSSFMELARRPTGPVATVDVSRWKVSSACFFELSLLIGYRDGEIWQWDLVTGKGTCIIESKHRGGIAEMSVVELDIKTRQDLGLRRKTYLVAAGKDGAIQCWSSARMDVETQDAWILLWSHSGIGTGISISVLSLDVEVPMVAAGYSNGAIKVWDLEQGNLIWTLSRGSQATTGLNSVRPLDRRFSQGSSDNHQPSHQGAITKLCFHALELEDGLTGEPAPRVWLVLSSSMDETVMVWMVEWEGLMCMPSKTNYMARVGSETTFSVQGAAGRSSGPTHLQDRPSRLLHSRSFGSTESMADSARFAARSDLIGTLSSSLPAPRLVGFMKQRGGKSMTVSNSCLYGVRRTESSAFLAGIRDHPVKPSHASILDAIAATGSSHMIRSRRKSEGGGGHASATFHGNGSTTSDQTTGLNSTSKRGWELWEADLYQCIFKDPGVWGLDLTVRCINLQTPPALRQMSERYRRRCSETPSNDINGARAGGGAVKINSNGSGMGVSVPVPQEGTPFHFSGQDSMGMEGRPRLQRKPGSFSHQSHPRGYVYMTGLVQPLPLTPTPSQEYGPFLFPTPSGRLNDEGSFEGDDQHGRNSNMEEPFLLPFVETKLIYTLPKQGRGNHVDQELMGDMRDIVVGYGNFIKIVRLQDDDDEDEHENGVEEESRMR